MPLFCGICTQDIKRLRVRCSKCKADYHQSCANYKGTQTLPASKVAAGWSCPNCLKPKRSSSTPLQIASRTSDDETEDPGQRSADSVGSGLLEQELNETLVKSIVASLKLELPEIIRVELRRELVSISTELSELKDSVSFLSDKYDQFAPRITNLESETLILKTDTGSLHNGLTEAKDKINALEQLLRESNIEINGVPENKDENLPILVQKVAKAVTVKLVDGDVLSCTRVAKMNKDSNKPRAIVAKLRSPRCRDELLSGVTRFNKANPKDKLKASHLDIANSKEPVYVTEHLSPANKSLHAAARIKAKELSYKYVWVRNGRIFVRKDDDSGKIYIKNIDSLKLII